ncbi:hypothetical protein AAKU55_005493 [Oxalobacteraceae bacterium GrIS 1.11]
MNPGLPLPQGTVRIEAASGAGAGGSLIALSSFEPYELADYLAALRCASPCPTLRWKSGACRPPA